MTPADVQARLDQIRAQLAAEWRLLKEGVHHDHLSDLAFLIAESEFHQSKLQALEALRDKWREQAKRLEASAWDRVHDEAFRLDMCADELDVLLHGAGRPKEFKHVQMGYEVVDGTLTPLKRIPPDNT